MSISVTSLRPASPTVSAWKRRFIFVESDVILKTAEFSKLLLTGNSLTSPNAIHPIRRFVLLVVHYVVGKLLSFEFF